MSISFLVSPPKALVFGLGTFSIGTARFFLLPSTKQVVQVNDVTLCTEVVA